jgi:hypothetical protein
MIPSYHNPNGFLHNKNREFISNFFLNTLLRSPLPAVGGDKGEGGPNGRNFFHPHLNPPPSKGEDIIGEISNIFG